jgi:membrane protein implicated in regulation of membrane protease activity
MKNNTFYFIFSIVFFIGALCFLIGHFANNPDVFQVGVFLLLTGVLLIILKEYYKREQAKINEKHQ